jgi:serine O-acetyltransferase
MLDKETKDNIESDKLSYGFNQNKFISWLQMTFGKKYSLSIALKCLISSRKYTYYLSNRKSVFNKIAYFIHSYRYNSLASRYCMELAADKMGRNVKFWHLGIVINCHSKIGDGCAFHGNNCVGNKGYDLLSVPTIGNNVDIGFGACIIGNVQIADNIIIGANSVVNKSFTEPNIIIAGMPAVKIGKRTDI